MAEAVVETESKQTTTRKLKDRIEHLIELGNARLAKLDQRLARVSKDKWSITSIRRRAETARADTIKRLDELPGEAISAVASASRARVHDLERGLKWVEKRLNGVESTEATPEHTPRSRKKAG